MSTHSVHRVPEKRSTHNRMSPIVCHRCGGSHLATVCRFIEAKCRACGKTGHIAKVCHSKATTPAHSKFKKSDRTHAVVDSPRQVPSSDTTSSSNVQSLSYTLFPVISRSQPIMLSVKANGHDLRMELDTGAAVSIISEDTFKSVFKDSVSITPTDISLRTYLGNQLPVLGSAEVEVVYNSQVLSLPLIVVKGIGSTLLGRNWLERLQLDWSSIHSVGHTAAIADLIKKHSNLFCQELGTLKGMEAKIFVPLNAQPRFLSQDRYRIPSKKESRRS